jgi:hypothetical protein
MTEIEKAVKDIQAQRKNPVLLLNLKRVRQVPELLFTDRILNGKKFETLDVVLQTFGGNIDAAFMFAKILRKSAKNLNIIVPLYAKSAGTLICLIADTILMTELSELGPLDTQISENQDGDQQEVNSALNGFKALEQVQQHNTHTLDIVTKLIIQRCDIKLGDAIHYAAEFCGNTSGTLYRHLNPKKIGEYARALEVGEYYGTMILTRYKKIPEKKAKMLANTLVYKYPSHEFVIDYEELQKLGIQSELIDNTLSAKLCDLRELFNKSEHSIIELHEYTPPAVPAKAKTTPKTSK